LIGRKDELFGAKKRNAPGEVVKALTKGKNNKARHPARGEK